MKSSSLTYRSLLLFSSLFILFVVLTGCSHHTVPVGLNQNQNGISAIAEAQTPAKTAQITAAVTAPVDEAPAPAVAAAGSEASEPSPAETAVAPQNEKNALAPKKENSDDEQSLLDTALELTETAQEYWEDGDMEQSIEALDQAYALILKVPGNNPKLSQQKEDLRFVISKRIMEMYASRKTSTVGTSAEIPMTMNAHVEREIQSFQTLERDFFIESYKRSGRYRGEMVKALQEAGLPEELSWLPLIESGFKVRALSRSRALGLWQFIPSTGYKFGLKRNAWIDERLDPEKATGAAIAYFQELHSMFGDWATVLAAYNCGEGSVARAIRDQKVDYLDNFWDFYERLPRETARYFPRFLAVLAILKDPAHYGFNLGDIDGPLSFETVTVERPVHLRSVAETLGIEIDELKTLNPELRRDATPNIAYQLKVPVGKGETLLASIETLAKWTPPKVEYVVHRVRRGETLSLIALRYRTSIQRILEANNLGSGRLLRVGQRLKIPMRTTT